MLFNGEDEIQHHVWLNQLFDQFALIADMLDSPNPERIYTSCLVNIRKKFIDEGQTLSTQMMQKIIDQQLDFCDFTLTNSLEFTNQLRQFELPLSLEKNFQSLVKKSLNDQKIIEKSDKISFDDYLKEYFSQNNN